MILVPFGPFTRILAATCYKAAMGRAEPLVWRGECQGLVVAQRMCGEGLGCAVIRGYFWKMLHYYSHGSNTAHPYLTWPKARYAAK